MFKEIPSTHFAMTLTTIYPFVVAEKPTWENKLKEHNYPITRLWPYGTLRRYAHFAKAFVKHRRVMFHNYEGNGGRYHAGSDSDNEDETGSHDSAHADDDTSDEDEVFTQD